MLTPSLGTDKKHCSLLEPIAKFKAHGPTLEGKQPLASKSSEGLILKGKQFLTSKTAKWSSGRGNIGCAVQAETTAATHGPAHPGGGAGFHLLGLGGEGGSVQLSDNAQVRQVALVAWKGECAGQDT